MLWFNHPKPVGRRKEVAVLVQRQAVAPTTLTLDMPDIDLAPPAEADFRLPAPLRFSVRYALPEYLSFMWQHAGYLIRRRRVGRAAGWYLQTKSTSFAGLNFLLTGRARRVYEFTIDQHGIVRASPRGVTLIKWEQVRAVRRYTRGYLLVLAQGTLPIPFRCLGLAQGAAMDGWLRQGAPR